MSKYTYRIECPFGDSWNAFIKDETRDFCLGYLKAMQGQAPRSHLRLIRSDGKLIGEASPKDDVSVGMIAGWPTAEQYERAANEALERANTIRANQAKQEAKG